MLTYQEAADVMGVKIQTLYTLVRRKQVPHVRLGRRLVRFPRRELEEWIRSRHVRPARLGVRGGA